jgi:RNA polymerase sigma factor (sigma-70 family)
VDSPTSLKKEWVLTKDAFDVFLSSLDRDRDRAGEKYENVRLKLMKYFQWCGVVSPDVEIDETINRVARKIQEGENVYNLNAYLYGVAKNVYAEWRKKQSRNQQMSEDENRIEAPEAEEEDHEARQRRICLDNCLQKLAEQSRLTIIDYYEYEKKDKSKHRKELAAKQGVTTNALRINVHRIRLSLEACVRECLGHYA